MRQGWACFLLVLFARSLQSQVSQPKPSSRFQTLAARMDREVLRINGELDSPAITVAKDGENRMCQNHHLLFCFPWFKEQGGFAGQTNRESTKTAMFGGFSFFQLPSLEFHSTVFGRSTKISFTIGFRYRYYVLFVLLVSIGLQKPRQITHMPRIGQM